MKLLEYVMTKLDGRQPIEWWDEVEFCGRTTKVYSGDNLDDMKLQQVIPIPDSVILCDYCNTRITEFPVPVFHHHALCGKCYKDMLN